MEKSPFASAHGRKDVMFYLPEEIVPYREQPAFRLTGTFAAMFTAFPAKESGTSLFAWG